MGFTDYIRYVPSLFYMVICAIPYLRCDACPSLMTYVCLSLVYGWLCQSVRWGSLSESRSTETAVGLFSGGLRVFIAFHRAFSFLPHASLLLRCACLLVFRACWLLSRAYCLVDSCMYCLYQGSSLRDTESLVQDSYDRICGTSLFLHSFFSPISFSFLSHLVISSCT